MPPGRPPGTPHGMRLRDLVYLSLLLPITATALQQQPPYSSGQHNAAAAASVEQQWPASIADSLHMPHNSGQRGYRDTDVNADSNQKPQPARTSSAHPKDGALATVSSPAENAASGQPPAQWASASSAGLTSRQPARSLQDWQVEDIMLLATVDGYLHARDRNTGAPRWSQRIGEGEMVETIRHRLENKTLDENGLEQEDPVFVVEPSQDGAIYMLAPGSGLHKVPYTVKQLADLSPYASEGYPAITYTAEKKSTLYTIDAATGSILKIFSSTVSIVNNDRDQSCRQTSPLDLEANECETIGTITLARTDFTIGMQDRNTGDPITTIKYFEWGPNNRDNDLLREYQTTKDSKYVLSRHNGVVLGKDLKLGQQAKPSYKQKFSTPVVRVFDVIRPSSDLSSDPSLVILPQPKFPAASKDVDDDTESVWVDCTDAGNWYALSEAKYPAITEKARLADYYTIGSTRGIPLSRRIFAGVHVLAPSDAQFQGGSHVGGRQAPLMIGPPSDQAPENTIKDIASPRKRDSYGPSTAQTIIFMLMVCLVGGGFVFQKGSIPWNIKLSVVKNETPQNVESVDVAEVKTEATMVREGEPAKEIIFPQENGVPTPQVRFDDLPKDGDSPERAEDEAAEIDEEGKDGAGPKKKKATRGKRAGRKQKEKELVQAEARARKNGAQVPQPAEVISVAASESPQVTGPLQINSLVIHTDKVIGQGSCGTIVFEGTFEGRDVAVKRMLSQYYELASQEVSFLQQSDDHPNVVRYFCQQKDDHFLYIAVELCQASLFEVWEADKAKTEERQRQLRGLKVSMQQDMSRTLQQLAAGLHHLHNLRIIHRDIKPQNILVAFPKRTQPIGTRLVISDFGLGKNLPENVSTLVDPTGNAGTSGWKAPELISQPRETSSNNTHSTSNGSESGAGAVSGVKRAADIFSLGCLFFWVLTDGVHPFEDENGWQQLRELNIKRDKKSMDALERWSDAYEPMQLISSMLAHQPENRPTAQAVLNHPYFWSPEKRLAFLCDVSDHFEREPRGTYEDNYAGDSLQLRMLEDRTEEVMGEPLDRADFLTKLDRQFVDTLGKQRKYSGYRVLDLLRALRNKKNHYEDMPENVKKLVGPLAKGYLDYWSNRFPHLLMTCYEVIHEARLEGSDRFKGYFALGQS